ncbi:MAG TPA: regulatory protein RecX [Bacteroidales bacterium]|nr:RecX family transcriptional regulator [Bacteroidales bacterium]HNZ42113.1 regulatory protein RecX [Bacteroidales bacterium]HOH83094.1 regulatory protein RecX [Bacteroidales bacterium]
METLHPLSPPMTDINKDLTGLKTILHRAREFCAYQERCRSEMEQKFQQWGVDRIRAAKMMEQLEKDNFLNEDRYTETFVRSKFRLKKWGKNKLAAELRIKKIPEDLIVRHLQHIDDAEYHSALMMLAEKKSKELTEKDTFKKNQKIARFLISKGYEPGLVFSALKMRDV